LPLCLAEVGMLGVLGLHKASVELLDALYPDLVRVAAHGDLRGLLLDGEGPGEAAPEITGVFAEAGRRQRAICRPANLRHLAYKGFVDARRAEEIGSVR
jgi:hypothetical protein